MGAVGATAVGATAVRATAVGATGMVPRAPVETAMVAEVTEAGAMEAEVTAEAAMAMEAVADSAVHTADQASGCCRSRPPVLRSCTQHLEVSAPLPMHGMCATVLMMCAIFTLACPRHYILLRSSPAGCRSSPHLPRETILGLLGGATELEARTATYIFRLLAYNSSTMQPALLVT